MCACVCVAQLAQGVTVMLLVCVNLILPLPVTQTSLALLYSDLCLSLRCFHTYSFGIGFLSQTKIIGVKPLLDCRGRASLVWFFSSVKTHCGWFGLLGPITRSYSRLKRKNNNKNIVAHEEERRPSSKLKYNPTLS